MGKVLNIVREKVQGAETDTKGHMIQVKDFDL